MATSDPLHHPSNETSGLLDPRRDIYLLVACQALLFTNTVSMIAVNSLAGLALAPNATMATLPVTSYVIGSALASAPIARMMKRHGRRVGFSVGTLFGMLGVVVAARGRPRSTRFSRSSLRATKWRRRSIASRS